jgi:hypothetical protein
MRHLAPKQSAERGLLLKFLHVDSHLGCQPTRAGTHSIKNTTTKHPERDLRIARKDFFWRRRRHERRRPCPHCRRSTRSLGSRQGAQGRIVLEPPEAENVTRRHRPDPSRPKSTLGEVEKAAKELGRDAAGSFCPLRWLISLRSRDQLFAFLLDLAGAGFAQRCEGTPNIRQFPY